MAKLSMLVILSVLAWMVWPEYDRLLPCPDPQGANPLKQPECFLVPTYELARARFREAAVKAGAKLDQLLLPCGYTIDVATLPGVDDSKLLLHISGTHGVEGFVGSAIQTGYLTWLAMQNKTSPSLRKRTTIFVHGLNAFGMANWRRVNENNVDLNRNGHATQADLDEVLSRDPNFAGYETWSHAINPQHAPRVILDDVMFAFNLLKVFTVSSISELKRALVSGTSTRSKGFMFVGRELQPSHVMLREYLTRNSIFDRVRDLILIDVHTGLGPLGNDTMIVADSDKLGGCERLFGWEGSTVLDKELEWKPSFGCEAQSKERSQDKLTSGYDLAKGISHMTYPTLFPRLKSSVSVAQEFGTFSLPILVCCIHRVRILTNKIRIRPIELSGRIKHFITARMSKE